MRWVTRASPCAPPLSLQAPAPMASCQGSALIFPALTPRWSARGCLYHLGGDDNRSSPHTPTPDRSLELSSNIQMLDDVATGLSHRHPKLAAQTQIPHPTTNLVALTKPGPSRFLSLPHTYF